MQESENQRAFRERVAKIEARRSADKAADKPKAVKRQHRTAAATSKRATYTLLTLLVLCVAAIPSLIKFVPNGFAIPSLGGSASDTQTAANTAPKAPKGPKLVTRKDGYQEPSSTTSLLASVVSIGGSKRNTKTKSNRGRVFLPGLLVLSPEQQVIAGAPSIALKDAANADELLKDPGSPWNVKKIPFNKDCNFRKPKGTELVQSVNIEAATRIAAVRALDDKHMVEGFERSIEASVGRGRPLEKIEAQSGKMGQIDVLITATDAPVYLILQTFTDQMVWNLNLAPDVTLAHVAVIGGTASAVAGVPEGVRVEMLRVSDFVYRRTKEEAEENPGPNPCYTKPWRKPQPHWGTNKLAQAGDTRQAQNMLYYDKGYAAYNDWYTAAFGQDTQTNIVSAQRGSHALVGPLPESPMEVKSLNGRTLIISPRDHVLTGSTQENQATLERLHVDLLETAIGRPIADLLPPTQER